MPVSILMMGIITVVYTYLGGLQAVFWTVCVQFMIYTTGAIVAGWLLVNYLPGGWADFMEEGKAAGKFTLINLSTNPTIPYTLWTGVLGGAFFSMASHGADQIMVQRYLCARNLNHARAALIASGAVVFLQFLLFLCIGIGLYALSKSGVWELPPDIRNDQVFGKFIVEKLPVGLVGLVIASVLAAAMSTLSSSLNSSASAVIADFYAPLRPGKSESQYLEASRLLTLIFGIAQIAVALCAWQIDSPRSVIDQVLSVAGLTTGMVLGLFLLGILKLPISSSAALSGMLFGFCMVMIPFFANAMGNPLVAWPWYAPIGTISTVVMSLAINQVLRPRPTR
jgi:SSS family solute:Na+ symporter